MSKKDYAASPANISTMPKGIPYIVGNEAAERFSFYGMRAVLTVFMVHYLWLMGDDPGARISDAEATARYHDFNKWVYLTPFFGAILADWFFGKYRIIIYLSVVYCFGHGALALMGLAGKAEVWFAMGLWMIIIGSGGIKPCVSAHVGDQFGAKNSHLLPKIFNWFYWSINLGAFASSLLTPWLLEWYGPHLAFGVPGVLMALATIVFWMGRWKFVHLPARGSGYFREVFSREGITAILKLCVIYAFVAVFWALFDQQGSSWILQAEDMDRMWLGVEWLPSQIQALNPILILIFIPLFAYVLYPAIDKVFPLTPLRKIGIGLFLMVIAFAMVSIAQEKIDAGETPNISWQVFAYALMTASEVMVSIVSLEFSYTQAPRSMKSLVMAFWLGAVFVGNHLTSTVNKVIQVPTPIVAMPGEHIYPGFDGKEGTEDDIQVRFNKEKNLLSLEYGGKIDLDQVASLVVTQLESNNNETISEEEGGKLVGQFKDPFGVPYRYVQVNRNRAQVVSSGPDKRFRTKWDQGATIEISRSEPKGKETWWTRLVANFRPENTWLEERKSKLGIATDQEIAQQASPITVTHFVGGQLRMQGATYFWFFTKLMLGAAILFVIVSKFYKPRDYLLKDEGDHPIGVEL